MLATPVAHASASALAEMAACLALAPSEVVKQNAQMLKSSSSSVPTSSVAKSSPSVQAFRNLVAGPGAARKLWAGYSALVARNLPFTALQFPVFEHVRAKVRRVRNGGGGNFAVNAAITNEQLKSTLGVDVAQLVRSYAERNGGPSAVVHAPAGPPPAPRARRGTEPGSR